MENLFCYLYNEDVDAHLHVEKQSLTESVILIYSLFFSLAIVLSVLLFKDYDYPFGNPSYSIYTFFLF